MIILLNGSINAGKSTVGRAIQKKLSQVAHVEVDALHHFIPWISHEESTPTILENAVSVIRNFIHRGFRVVMTWPLSQRDYDYLCNELSNLNVPIVAIALCPGVELALTNRGTRQLDNWELNRVSEMYEIGLATPKFGFLIDNSRQSLDETVNNVLDLAQWKAV
jgi:hypothetical protein